MENNLINNQSFEPIVIYLDFSIEPLKAGKCVIDRISSQCKEVFEDRDGAKYEYVLAKINFDGQVLRVNTGGHTPLFHSDICQNRAYESNCR